MSARLKLYVEGVALVLVALLGFLVWHATGYQLDSDQVRLEGTNPGAVISGIVLVIFGFSGFESSSSLGEEAKRPLITIPRSIVLSVIVCGFVFAFMAYIVVLGFKGASVPLDKSEAPLVYLASKVHAGTIGYLINIGVLLSFFSCILATINSTARILFAMARHGLFTDFLGDAHRTNDTPHVAIVLTTIVTFLVPAICFMAGISPLDSQGYLGTPCSFGFLVVYILISIAAPFYLRRVRENSGVAITLGVVGALFMVLPFIGMIGIPGSAIFPPPTYPNKRVLPCDRF